MEPTEKQFLERVVVAKDTVIYITINIEGCFVANQKIDKSQLRKVLHDINYERNGQYNIVEERNLLAGEYEDYD